MSVYARISSSSSEILAISEFDMLSIRVLVALSQAKINDIDIVPRSLRGSDEEVIWLNVSVNYSLLMHLLDSFNLHIKIKQLLKISIGLIYSLEPKAVSENCSRSYQLDCDE